MAINLGNIDGINNISGVLNLQKMDVLDLTKREPGLKKVTLGAGWDIANMGSSFDLDIAAFLLNSQGKVTLDPLNVVFFNNKIRPGVVLDRDNRTGAGDGDDERIYLELDKIDSDIEKIVFITIIHQAEEKRQTFGMVNNSYVRLINTEENKEICRFNLKDDSSTATGVIFAELYKESGEWYFKAIGEGKRGDLNDLLSFYL